MTADRKARHRTLRHGRAGAVTSLGFTLALLAASCGGSSPDRGGPAAGSPPTTAAAPTTAGPVTTVGTVPSGSAVLQTALTGAYQAETRALATYQDVVSSLGSVGPFPNVIVAEKSHVAAVAALLDRYGIALPGSAEGVPSPATLPAACALGVSLEQQVIAFYADQIPKVSAYRDVTTAFGNLQTASHDSHLPAFQHCS